MRACSGVLHWQEGEGSDMLQFPLRKTSLTEGGTDGVNQSESWEEQGSFLGGAKVIRAVIASSGGASTNPAAHSRYRISHHASGPKSGHVHQGVRRPGHLLDARSVVAVKVSTLASGCVRLKWNLASTCLCCRASCGITV